MRTLRISETEVNIWLGKNEQGDTPDSSTVFLNLEDGNFMEIFPNKAAATSAYGAGHHAMNCENKKLLRENPDQYVEIDRAGSTDRDEVILRRVERRLAELNYAVEWV